MLRSHYFFTTHPGEYFHEVSLFPTSTPRSTYKSFRFQAFVDSQRERLGWLDLESDRIQWVDISPHGVLVSSRPRWIGENEVVFSAWIHRVGVTPLLVDLDSGELEVWGDLDLWANWVEPAGDNRFYACIMVWDPDARRLYNAVALLTFARQE